MLAEPVEVGVRRRDVSSSRRAGVLAQHLACTKEGALGDAIALGGQVSRQRYGLAPSREGHPLRQPRLRAGHLDPLALVGHEHEQPAHVGRIHLDEEGVRNPVPRPATHLLERIGLVAQSEEGDAVALDRAWHHQGEKRHEIVRGRREPHAIAREILPTLQRTTTQQTAVLLVVVNVDDPNRELLD